MGGGSLAANAWHTVEAQWLYCWNPFPLLQIQQNCLEGWSRLRCSLHLSERFEYTMEAAPQFEEKLRGLTRQFIRHCQRTFLTV